MQSPAQCGGDLDPAVVAAIDGGSSATPTAAATAVLPRLLNHLLSSQPMGQSLPLPPLPLSLLPSATLQVWLRAVDAATKLPRAATQN